MNLVLNLSVATCLAFAAAVTSQAKIEGSSSNKTITVCHPEYTLPGKQASFHFNYIFLATTNRVGEVKEIRKVYGPRITEFIREDKIVECARTWKLEPSTKYSILFSLGTSSKPDFITIRKHGGETIKLILE